MADYVDGKHQETISQLRLVDLTNDALLCIFRFCDPSSLKNLSETCKRLYYIINEDIVWLKFSNSCLITNQSSEQILYRCLTKLIAKERCRIGLNWKYGCYKEKVYSTSIKYMPWLQLEADTLWISRGINIVPAKRLKDQLKLQPPLVTRHTNDISRFIKTDDIIFTGGKDKYICGWSTKLNKQVLSQRSGHSQDIQGLDCCRSTLVSCSKDGTIKIWHLKNSENNFGLWCDKTVTVSDRVWCVNIDPSLTSVAAGSAGYCGIHPLHIYDLERGVEKCGTKTALKNGAAVFDIQWLCTSTLITCGFDSVTRLWDTRVGRCVKRWSDVFGAPGYCLATDFSNSILVGTAHHGRVQLWDKRSAVSVQAYFGRSTASSPVYSLSFDTSQLFIAQDSCVNVLDFSPHFPSHSPRGDYSSYWTSSLQLD